MVKVRYCTLRFVVALGVAAVATFVHTPAPLSPLNHMQHMMPKYMHEMHLPTSTYSDSLGTLGDMVRACSTPSVACAL